MAHRSIVSFLARARSFFMRRLFQWVGACYHLGAACGSETPTGVADAGTVVDRVAHDASFASKPTWFFHPIDFLTSPLHWACPEAPFADRRPDRRSTSKAVRSAIPLADLTNPVLQISPPNKRLFAEHLPANPLPGSSSFHEQQAVRRATGGHNETPLNDEFHLEGQGSRCRHRQW